MPHKLQPYGKLLMLQHL